MDTKKNLAIFIQDQLKILKKEDKIFGEDKLKKTKNYLNQLNYFVRFHIYPDTKIVKTKAGKFNID